MRTNEIGVIDWEDKGGYPVRWSYFTGPLGLGGFTRTPDHEGWYWSFFCRPAGKGARSAIPEYYKRVYRFDSKRRTKKASKQRAYELAFGKTKKEPKPSKDAMTPGMGYCMKDKTRVIMANAVGIVNDKGRHIIKGECPDCGTAIQKFGKLAECPECGKMAEMAGDDYVCKVCRGDS